MSNVKALYEVWLKNATECNQVELNDFLFFLTTDLLPMVLLQSEHGDRFVIGVVGGVAPPPTTRIPGAKTNLIPSNVRLVAPVLDSGFSNFVEYAETPRDRGALCNPTKANSFSGVEQERVRNGGKPHGIMES